MLRLLAVITAAAARPEDATEYFDAASSLCAAAWRRRAEHGAAALGRKYPTVVPRLLATCA